MMGAPSMNNLVEDLESKDTKRRLQGLDILEQSLRQTSPAEDSWKQVVAPLMRTLRDNNFKVCRVGLTCLESLVGHVDSDISPFLSTIIPAVVECLGISKSAVQEKGIDFLLAISSPAVNGARDTITALDPHFRHKNWRVREKLVVFLGRAVEVDGAGVMGRPPAALAGILADALNDSACQVRQAALVAAGTLVELTGESLLTQLEQRGVRNAQLASLRLKSVQRDGGSNLDQTPSAAGRGPLSPAVVGLRQTAALRKPLRSAAGTAENAPTPATTRSGGGGGGYSSSPVAVGSPSWLSDGGEDSAFSALEPLVPVRVCTERDVRREVEAAKACLEHGSDWQGWVGAMRRLAGVALGGAAEEFPALLVGLVRASVQEMVGHKVSENRSAVAREACRCVAVLARCLTDHFGALAELWLPELLRNTTRAVVVAAAGDEAARAIFGCTTAGFARLLPCLIDTARNKSAAIRRRCLDYVMLALSRWGDVAFDRYLPQLRNMIATAVGDADGSTRATARRAFWVLKKRFPELAQSIMDSLSPSMQRHVLREDREFDVDAFVKAVNAAAEDPQPALGECTKERGIAAAGSCPASVNPSPNSHPSSSTAATRRTKDGQFSSAPIFSVAAASTGSGGERISQPPRFSASATVGIVRTSNAESGGSGGGNSGNLMRSARSKIDRVGVGSGSSSSSNGVGGVGAAGGGEGGVRVMRPGGGAPTRKARGKSTPQQVKDDGGGAMDSGRVTPTAAGALRVPCGNAVAAVAFNNGAAEAMIHHGGSIGGDYPSAAGGAQRVARKPTLAVSSTGVSAAVDSRGAEREGFPGGGGIAAGRIAGRQRGGSSRASTADSEQQQQRHRWDADEGRGGEAADIGSERPLREVAGPVVLDRREVLRKMDSLVEQAGLPHWAARVEALEGLLKLLTVEANGDGGRIVLESRAAARRLESMIAKRVRDVHFKVSSIALKLFGGLVEAHPDPTAGHADALLPLVFPSLADTKEPVRLAASRALDACRAAYPSNDLCAALCPRVLEFAPGRARTGLLEFLTVLVPHSAKYLSGQGHMQALTQRVAAALMQSPPPMSWDGGLGDSQGGPTSAGVEASAAIRLLTALFHVDREAFVMAVAGTGVGKGGSLPPESVAAVRRALAHSCPGVAELVSPSPVQQPQEQQFAHTDTVTSHTHHGQWASVAAPATVKIAIDDAKNESDSRGGKAMPVGISLPTPSVSVSKRITTEDSVKAMINFARIGTGGDRSGFSRNESNGGDAMAGEMSSVSSFMLAQDSQQQLQQHQGEERRPLASVTLRDSGNAMQAAVVNTPLKDNENLLGSRPASAKPGMENIHVVASLAASNSNVSTQSPPLTAEREALEVARRLISGLSPGARSNQKVEALSSLRALADGEGVGGHVGFWPRYFGQVLTLLLDGAAAASTRAERRSSGGERPIGTPKSPSRRRALFRVKYLQGVRCLAARRGALFVGYTETVTERLVEIGAGDPCAVVRCEVEACMVDLVTVLDPPRFLAALTPLLFVGAEPDSCGSGGGAGQSGNEFVDSAETTGRDVLAQCVALDALRALTPRLSSPCLLGALGAGPLMLGLGAALEGMDMEARRGAVMVFVEIYQVLEEALLPFLSGFHTSRLKLITMYIEQRRALDNRAAAGEKANVSSQWARSGGGPGFGETGRGARVLTPTSSNVFKPMR